MSHRTIDFSGRPSVVAYMLRALYPGQLRKPPPFPELRARWRGARPDPARLRRFLDITGLDTERGVPLLYFQLVTFPLQMAILTDRRMPLPIWKVLQVRNRMLLHASIPPDAWYETEASVGDQRVLERGLEVDINVGVRVEGALAWEGLTTYHYRGRFGQPVGEAARAVAPAEPMTGVASWRSGSGDGLRFSGISGDYNGIHLSNAYARLLGFRGAFHHPHALVGQCLARLRPPAAPAQSLDLWLKSPVYYGSQVTLRARDEDGSVVFSVVAGESARPALLGRWSRVLARGEP